MGVENYKKALLIDDSKIDNLIHSKVIESVSFAGSVIMEESPVDALQFLQDTITNAASLPDIIFLDINMPEMTGFEFLEEFDKLPSQVTANVKIIMLSSSLEEEDRRKAEKNKHVIAFINKPLTKQALLNLGKYTF